jgi:hypothetical protein
MSDDILGRLEDLQDKNNNPAIPAAIEEIKRLRSDLASNEETLRIRCLELATDVASARNAALGAPDAVAIARHAHILYSWVKTGNYNKEIAVQS